MQYPKKLKDKIRLICKLMQRPYHLIVRIAANTYMFEIFDGTTQGNFINWTGISPANAVDEAIEYVKHEIEMGAVEVPVETKDKTKDKPKTRTTQTIEKTNKKIK